MIEPIPVRSGDGEGRDAGVRHLVCEPLQEKVQAGKSSRQAEGQGGLGKMSGVDGGARSKFVEAESVGTSQLAETPNDLGQTTVFA